MEKRIRRLTAVGSLPTYGPGVVRKGGMQWFVVSLFTIHLLAGPSHHHFYLHITPSTLYLEL